MSGEKRAGAAALPALLAVLIVLVALWKRRSDRQAAEALERWRKKQSEAGKRKRKGRQQKKGRGEGKKKSSSAKSKRLLRFLLLAAVREAITRQLKRMREELPESRLISRLSPPLESET